MAKCPYCARPLRGVRCRACRRYVLGRRHVILLAAAAIAAALVALELLFRLT